MNGERQRVFNVCLNNLFGVPHTICVVLETLPIEIMGTGKDKNVVVFRGSKILAVEEYLEMGAGKRRPRRHVKRKYKKKVGYVGVIVRCACMYISVYMR